MKIRMIVIGGGPGGYVAALQAALMGAQVTLVEKEDLGGTCLNWGCIPSKIMKQAADMVSKFKQADQYGITMDNNIGFNMKMLMAKKNKVLESQRNGIESLLKNRSIHIEKGQAVIKSHNRVDVIFKDGSIKEFEYDRLIIATGTTPFNVPDFPFDHTSVLSSDDLLNLEQVPSSIVIVGAGVIGCEFAFILSALGSKVTLVEAMSRVLPFPDMDMDISKLLLREMKKRKITVLCDTIVQKIETKNQKSFVYLDHSPFTDNPDPKPIKTRLIETQKIGVCIGRSPNTAGLGLEKIGVELSEKGWINVDEYCQTQIKGVFAIGDILGPQKIMLAHVASHEGLVAAANAMGHEKTMDYSAVPMAIFTMPEIGSVGLTEKTATQKGYHFRVETVNFRNLGKAHAIDELAGMGKMIVQQTSDTILGVHLIGAHATDLIAEAVLAVKQQMSVKDLSNIIHAHPTLSEIMGELALKASGMSVHG
ncbi:MAG: dihydrolipoyl dehydrogenase [Pseudomonadota bacterium]